MSERRRIIVLALLVGLHAAAAVLLAPVDFLQPESFSGYVKFAVVGVFLVPPATLAFCAAFGPWPITVRLPLTTWLVCVLALLLTYGARRGDFGYGLASDASELMSLCFGAPLVEFLVLLLPLALLRAVRHWQLEASSVDAARGSEAVLASTSSPQSRSSGQFTLRALFGWTLAAASIFAGLQWLFSGQGLAADEWGEVMVEGMVQGAATGVFLAVAGLPVLSIAWLLLALGRRLVLRLALLIVTTGGIATVLACNWWNDQDIESLLVVASLEAGVIAAGLATVAVIRACGYHLVRRPRRVRSPQPIAPPISWPQRRFSWTLTGLALPAIALACCVPARMAVWRQAAETRRWAEVGLEVLCDNQGRTTCIQGNGTRLTDEYLRRFAELPDLVTLKFERLRDSQLAALAAPACLDSLSITDPRFTDKGLQHLDRFAQLRELNLLRTSITNAGLARMTALKQLATLDLSITDVTDRGLEALVQCRQLRWIDLSLTAVTKDGARRLSEALPEATITIGACDAAMRTAVLHCRGDVRKERLHACGKYQSFGRSRTWLMPATLTDAGLKVLNTNMQLKELDLRETAVTDAGIPALFALKTLKRVDLRDTAVTETGRVRLANVLPNCEILR